MGTVSGFPRPKERARRFGAPLPPEITRNEGFGCRYDLGNRGVSEWTFSAPSKTANVWR